jgi:hypothetical protein
LRELLFKIRDQIELHKPLPKTGRELGALYKKKRENQYCYSVTTRIQREWDKISSIEMIVAASGEQWMELFRATEHCPNNHPMRSEMLDLLLARAWWPYQTKMVLKLTGRRTSDSLPFEINGPDEPGRM